MKRVALPLLAALGVFWLGGCEEDDPTGISPDLFPVTPVTISVEIPWETVGTEARLFDDFGRPSEALELVLARSFDGRLDARGLARIRPFLNVVQVPDSTGQTGPTSLTIVGGRVVARVDTADAVSEGMSFQASRIVTEWDPETATWFLAVDSLDDQRSWQEAGAGGSIPLGAVDWTIEDGDSVSIDIDSAAVAALVDTLDPARGVMLELLGEGERIEARDIDLVIRGRPLSNPDTVVEAVVGAEATTFIYDPVPTPGEETLLVGGVPSWRTVLGLEMPAMVEGPPELCAVASCPFTLDPDQINVASLVLTTREADPGLAPRDTIAFDVRSVLAPDRLPKSPLGPPLVLGRRVDVDPAAFVGDGGRELELPITPFVRDQLRDSTSSGGDPATTVSVLSVPEGRSFDLAWFSGPAGVDPPFVRVILTLADSLRIR